MQTVSQVTFSHPQDCVCWDGGFFAGAKSEAVSFTGSAVRWSRNLRDAVLPPEETEANVLEACRKDCVSKGTESFQIEEAKTLETSHTVTRCG